MHAEALRHGSDDRDLPAAVLMALALHVGLAVVLVLAGWWQPVPAPVSVAGPVVEAALVVSDADVRTAERAAAEAPKPAPPPPPEPVAEQEAAPPPQPEPSPRPQDSPEEPQPVPQAPPPRPDTRDQEAAARLALEQEQAKAREEQEARQRQAQIDLTERKQREEEAERRQRLREQQLARLEEIRRQRAEAARRARMEEQRLEQLADRQSAPPAERPSPAPSAPAGGNEGTDTDLRAQYALAIQRAIESNWIRPDTVPKGAVCPILIVQLRGGKVISAEVQPGCPYDDLAQRSVEAAVLRAEPLPYDGFEAVFERSITLKFRVTED